jgi:hypothetical protein
MMVNIDNDLLFEVLKARAVDVRTLDNEDGVVRAVYV